MNTFLKFTAFACFSVSTLALAPIMAAPPAAAHAHATTGPHKGDLIELGNDEYHLEMVHDDKVITMYVLDGEAKNLVPVDATDISINVMHFNKPEQFKLLPKKTEGEPAGKNSTFMITDGHLIKHLGHGTPKVALTISGKAYRGTIKHSHDHDHDHKPTK
jgi:hypothetical protein